MVLILVQEVRRLPAWLLECWRVLPLYTEFIVVFNHHSRDALYCKVCKDQKRTV